MKMSDINDDLLLGDVDDQDLNEDELLLSDEDDDTLRIKSHLALDEEDDLLEEPNESKGSDTEKSNASKIPASVALQPDDTLTTESTLQIKPETTIENENVDNTSGKSSKEAQGTANELVGRRNSRPVLKRNNVSNVKLDEVSSTIAMEDKNIKEANKIELNPSSEVVPEKIARASSPKAATEPPKEPSMETNQPGAPKSDVKSDVKEKPSIKAPDLETVSAPNDKKHASDEDEREERYNPKQVSERDVFASSPEKNHQNNARQPPHSSPRHFKGNNAHFTGQRNNHQFPPYNNNNNGGGNGGPGHPFPHNTGAPHSGNENFNPQPSSQFGPNFPNFRPQRPSHHLGAPQQLYCGGGDYRMPMHPHMRPQRPQMPPNGDFSQFHGNRPDFNNPNQQPFRPLAGPNGPHQAPGGMPQRFGGMRPHGPTQFMQRPQIGGGGAPMGQYPGGGGPPCPPNRHPGNFHMQGPQNVGNSAGGPSGPAILPRKVLINPNFKGGVEAATNQLMNTLQNGQFRQAGPSDAELLRQQEAFINQNRRHIEKRRHERSPPPRDRSRERSYTPPRSRRPHSRERRGREFYRARRGDSREDARSSSKKRRSASLERETKGAKKEVEEDEETRKYRLMIEQQKEKREKLLRDKEMRRRLAAEKKTDDEDKRSEPAPNKLTPIQVQPGKIISLRKKDSSAAAPTTKETQPPPAALGLHPLRHLPVTKILLEAKKENASATAVVKPLNKIPAALPKRTVFTSNNMVRVSQDRPNSADEDDESLGDDDDDTAHAHGHNDSVSDLDEDLLLEDELHTEVAAPFSSSRRIVLKPSSDLPAQQLLRRKAAATSELADDRSKGVFDRLERKILSDAAKRKIQRIVINNTE